MIVLKMLGATVQNLVTWVTRCTGFVHLCFRQIILLVVSQMEYLNYKLIFIKSHLTFATMSGVLTGQSRVQFLAGVRGFFRLQNVHTGSGAHPVCYSMGTRDLRGHKAPGA
jgi:hypothetical protein